MANEVLPPIDYTARDFPTIRAALIQHVQTFFPNDWQDYLSSNLGVTILEIVAYVGDNLSFYMDRQANESYLATAEQRVNVINLAKLIGYTPKTATPAVLPIRARITAAQASIATVDAYTKVSDKDGTAYEFLTNVAIPIGVTDTNTQTVTNQILGTADGVTTVYVYVITNEKLILNTVSISFTISSTLHTVTFNTDGAVVLPFGGSGVLDSETGQVILTFIAGSVPDNASVITVTTYSYNQDIRAYEGETNLATFSSVGTADQQFTLVQSPVLVNSIISEEEAIPDPARFEVWLGVPSSPFGVGTGDKWTRVESLVEGTATDEIYEVSIDEQDRATVIFGDSITGKIPPTGTTNINVIYRVGGGLSGNVSIDFLDTTVQAAVGAGSVSTRVTNFEPGSGGAPREPVEEIRVNAPKALRTNDTATTEADFTTLGETFRNPTFGNIARAKSRLSPPTVVTSKTVHTAASIGNAGAVPVLVYFLRMPATPIVVEDAGGTVVLGTTHSATAETFGDERVIEINTDVAFTAPDEIGSTAIDLTVFTVGTVVTVTGSTAGTNDASYTVITSTANLLTIAEGGITTQGAGPSVTLLGDLRRFETGGGTEVDEDLTRFRVDVQDTEEELIATGDGATLIFSQLMDNEPILPQSLVISYIIGGVKYIAYDDGVTPIGVLVGPNVSVVASEATIDYTTGELLITFTAGNFPDLDTAILCSYESALRLEFTSGNEPDTNSDITVTMESGPTSVTIPTNLIEVYTWAFDSSQNLVRPSAALKDQLKAFLDLRRVIATSISVLDGQSISLSFDLLVTYETVVSVTETDARIVAALTEHFTSTVTIGAGTDVVLAGIYDAIFPLLGVTNIVIDKIRVRVPIGVGDGVKARFKTDALQPGSYITVGKLPGVAGTDLIKVYKGATEVGASDATTPIAVLSGSGIVGSSTFDINTGDFDVIFNPVPDNLEEVAIEWTLDEDNVGTGLQIWNVDIDSFEIGVLGEVTSNGSAIN